MEKRRRVLVIDDEEIVLRCCLRVLAPTGCKVDTAKDGVEGLKMVSREEYDVVFTDMKLPGLDGQELVKNIKRLSPGSRVVVVTGYATELMREQAEEAGADEFIPKPFHPSGIIEAIK